MLQYGALTGIRTHAFCLERAASSIPIDDESKCFLIVKEHYKNKTPSFLDLGFVLKLLLPTSHKPLQKSSI
jgi:hypothetical protein